MTDLVLALCFVAIVALIGGLAYTLLVQRRELDACARQLREVVQAFNGLPPSMMLPEPPRVPLDPDLPGPPSVGAIPGAESLVRLQPVRWAEWGEEER